MKEYIVSEEVKGSKAFTINKYCETIMNGSKVYVPNSEAIFSYNQSKARIIKYIRYRSEMM